MAEPARSSSEDGRSRTRWLAATAEGALVPLATLAIALAAGAVVILALGKSPLAVARVVAAGTLHRHPELGWYGLGQVLYKSTTLAACGLAVAFALRAGLFNIGAEGQLALGGFTAALVGGALPASVGGWAAPVCLAAAMAGGAAAALVPAGIKTWRGGHEVVATIMMNFIIAHGIAALAGVCFVPGTTRTPRLPEGACFERYTGLFPGASVNAVGWWILAAAVVCAVVLARTQAGYAMTVVGANPRAARLAGVSLERVTLATFLASGALAGLAGANFVLGGKGYFEEGFSAGAGFLGIAVALLAQNRPLAVVPAAFFLAFLSEGGVAMGSAPSEARVPRATFDVLQAIVILAAVVGGRVLGGWRLRWLAGGER